MLKAHRSEFLRFDKVLLKDLVSQDAVSLGCTQLCPWKCVQKPHCPCKVLQLLPFDWTLLIDLVSNHNRQSTDEWQRTEDHLKALGATVVATEAALKDVYSTFKIYC